MLSIPGTIAWSSIWPSGRSTGSRAQSESIDDSDGECGALLERARDIHIRAARGARPDPLALARDLFERETGDGYGTFDGAAWLYADVLGEAGLAEYRRLATEAWEKLPPLTGRSREKAEDDYYGLSGILDSFGERDNVEARIALRAKDLSSPWKYLELAEFCLRHKGAKEALRWAEEGLWTFEDAPSDARLVLFAANPFMKAIAEAKPKPFSSALSSARRTSMSTCAGARQAARRLATWRSRWLSAGRRPRPGPPSAILPT